MRKDLIKLNEEYSRLSQIHQFRKPTPAERKRVLELRVEIKALKEKIETEESAFILRQGKASVAKVFSTIKSMPETEQFRLAHHLLPALLRRIEYRNFYQVQKPADLAELKDIEAKRQKCIDMNDTSELRSLDEPLQKIRKKIAHHSDVAINLHDRFTKEKERFMKY